MEFGLKKKGFPTYRPSFFFKGDRKQVFFLALLILAIQVIWRSRSNVVDNTLDFQLRGRKIDSPLLWSFRQDFKLRSHIHTI